MAAVVGTDEALAALPGGPVVGGGMAGQPLSKLCFGVLMWEPLHMPDLMQWPVWIEKQLYIVSGGCWFWGGGVCYLWGSGVLLLGNGVFGFYLKGCKLRWLLSQ